MSLFPIGARASLVDRTADMLRGEIAAGRWGVGEKIPVEPRLAEMLGVSRGTVREAVKVLAAAGLVEVRQGAGTFVRARQDPADALRRMRRAGLRDQFELRCALEAEGARLAARRAAPADIAELHRLLDVRGDWSGEAADKPGFVARDYAFHLAMVAASKNQPLVDLYRFAADAVTETIASTLGEDIPEPDLSAHRAVVEAIAGGDPDAADAAVRRFMAPMIAALERRLAS